MSPKVDLSTWPTEDHVAALLGVSTKTLKRERDKGLWETRARQRDGKKPEIVYNPDQVQARMPGPVTSIVKSQGPPPEETDSMDTLSALTESAVAVMPALMDLIEQRAAAMQPKPIAMWIPLDQASEITGLSEGFLRRVVKAERLQGVMDVRMKVRTASLETLDPTDMPKAAPRKRGKPKSKAR